MGKKVQTLCNVCDDRYISAHYASCFTGTSFPPLMVGHPITLRHSLCSRAIGRFYTTHDQTQPLPLEGSETPIYSKASVYQAASATLSAIAIPLLHILRYRPQHDSLALLRCHPTVSRTPPRQRQEPAVCTAKERSVFGLCRAMTPWPSFILPAGPPLLKRRAAAWASEKCFFQSPRLPLCSWCPPPASLGHRAPKSTALPPALGLTSGFLQPQPERYGRAVFVTERSRRVHEGALRAEMIHCS